MSSAPSISIPLRPTALRRTLPFAAMFTCSLVLGMASAAGAMVLTGSVLAGIVALLVTWTLLPLLGYKFLSKKQKTADRPGPFILLEDGFLTIPHKGGSDMGVDLSDVVLCTFVLEVWLRVHTQPDGRVIKSNLRQRLVILQLEQPKLIVRFQAELSPSDKVPALPCLHRAPSAPAGCEVKLIDIWLDDLIDFLSVLRASGIRETEAKASNHQTI